MTLLVTGIALALVGALTATWGVAMNARTPTPVGPIPTIGGGLVAVAGFLCLFAWLVRL